MAQEVIFKLHAELGLSRLEPGHLVPSPVPGYVVWGSHGTALSHNMRTLLGSPSSLSPFWLKIFIDWG